MYESTDFRMALVINVSLHNGTSEVCSQIAMFFLVFFKLKPAQAKLSDTDTSYKAERTTADKRRVV